MLGHILPHDTGNSKGVYGTGSEELEKASQSRLLRLFASQSKERLKQQLGAFRLGKEENDNDHI
jgi:hypothetical protein